VAEVKLVDLEDLAARASAALNRRSPNPKVSAITELQGGTSSLTYSAEVDEGDGPRTMVIKVAPPGIPPVRNRDMIRQARILQVLHDVPGIAVPEVHATDAGDPPDIPPFFVMEFVPGESVEPVGAPNDELDSSDMERRALAAMRMAAAMHRTDCEALGLGDEPVTSPRAEVERWEKSFSSIEGDLHPPLVDECTARLLATVPASMAPAILHGDWRLGNMQCVGPEIRAVIDWEIWSVGDPRVDLAWFLLMSDDRRSQGMVRNGVPSEEALVAAYEAELGAQVADMAWFGALVRYKQAAAGALIVKNSLRRDPESPVAKFMAPSVFGNLEGCREILDGLNGDA
jgi:aminoglycoside phosphotransferase (APT) family kinase protein